VLPTINGSENSVSRIIRLKYTLYWQHYF